MVLPDLRVGRRARGVFAGAPCYLAALALVSCSRDEPEPAVLLRHLSGMIPADEAVARIASWAGEDDVLVRPGETPGTFLIGLPLPPGRWEEVTDGRHLARFSLGFNPRLLPEGSFELLSGERPLQGLDAARLQAGEPGFQLRPDGVTLRTRPEDGLPTDLRLEVTYRLAERVAGGWRPVVGGYEGEGIAVPSGTSVEVTADVLPDSVLRFHAVGEPLALGPDRLDECPLDFRVTLDGEIVFEGRESVHRVGKGSWHEVELPPSGVRGARLRFSVEGPPAVAAFFQPTLGPRRPARRADTRPDLILLVLDTLRADGLAHYGGDPEVAPNLNAFVEKGVRYSRAWASASWTLPSHATMMSGLEPEQHGALLETQSLPAVHVTLAEHLRAAGYRTVASTEGLFVSPRHGIDQGFELFFANTLRIFPHTLEKAEELLRAEDGRPTFLFVHTYRAHSPYRVGPDDDATAYNELMAEMEPWVNHPDRDEVVPRFEGRLRELYFGGVSALDAQLGPWLAGLEEAGFFDGGFLLLTSDHGDELLEHGRIGHGHHHWEELTRIPLVLRGPGLAPRDVEHPATLVDLAPTLAQLAGVAPRPEWVGRSLLELAPDRVVFTYNSGPERLGTLRSGDRKLFFELDLEPIRAGRVRSAYDLARDPGERNDLIEDEPDWAAALLKAQARRLEELLRPRARAEDVELSDEDMAELRALGYGGD